MLGMMFMWIVPILLLAFLWDCPDRRDRSTPWIMVVAMLLMLPVLGLFWMGGAMHGYGYALPTWAWVAGGLLLLLAIGISGYLALRPGSRETKELRILKLRLARGEITPADYDLLRKKLSS